MSNLRLSNTDTSNYTEFLEKILNPDGIVQIGNYIIKINVGKNLAYAIFAKDSLHYQSLLEENISDSVVYAFPLEIEILKKMDSIAARQNVNTSRTEFWGLICNQPWAIQRSVQIYSENKYNCVAVYRARAIYFDYYFYGVLGYSLPVSSLNLNVNGNGTKRCINHNKGLNEYLKLELRGDNFYEKYAYQGVDAFSNYSTTFILDDGSGTVPINLPGLPYKGIFEVRYHKGN